MNHTSNKIKRKPENKKEKTRGRESKKRLVDQQPHAFASSHQVSSSSSPLSKIISFVTVQGNIIILLLLQALIIQACLEQCSAGLLAWLMTRLDRLDLVQPIRAELDPSKKNRKTTVLSSGPTPSYFSSFYYDIWLNDFLFNIRKFQKIYRFF
jgi:hypothetical protein